MDRGAVCTMSGQFPAPPFGERHWGMPMTTEDDGSVTRWIGDLKAGDADAAGQLWQRYFDGLVRLARKKLAGARKGGAVEDEEDAALSAFKSLCAGAALGRFDLLKDRDDLWKLLVKITLRKVFDQVERQGRQKRGSGRLVGAEALAGVDPDSPGGFDQCIGREPTPAFAAMLVEELELRLDRLDDPSLKQVALWRMEGYTNNEIAAKLGCVSRSVERKLDLIRKAWLREGP
jgi:DNA-directed RNA polymerase specialized sigma24 family protein